MKHSNRISQYKRADALAQVNAITVGHLILGVLALAGNDYQFADSPHGMYCLGIAAMVFVGNRVYAWDKPTLNWTIVAAYLLFTINELAIYGLPASVLDFSEEYSKGAMLDGIMYMVSFIYVALRFGLVLPLVAVARHSPKNSNPVSTGQ